MDFGNPKGHNLVQKLAGKERPGAKSRVNAGHILNCERTGYERPASNQVNLASLHSYQRINATCSLDDCHSALRFAPDGDAIAARFVTRRNHISRRIIQADSHLPTSLVMTGFLPQHR